MSVALYLAAAGGAAAADIYDIDGDGHAGYYRTGISSDCDDRDPSVHENAPDPRGDGFDQGCHHVADRDRDGWWVSTAANGPRGDCNDRNRRVNYGAKEIRGNRVDENCDDVLLPDVDGDGARRPYIRPDGSRDPRADCNDGRVDIGPHAREIPANDVDENCDGFLADVDGDGLDAPSDCDDRRAAVRPGARERRGNGRDDDCRPTVAISIRTTPVLFGRAAVRLRCAEAVPPVSGSVLLETRSVSPTGRFRIGRERFRCRDTTSFAVPVRVSPRARRLLRIERQLHVLARVVAERRGRAVARREAPFTLVADPWAPFSLGFVPSPIASLLSASR